MDKNNVKSETKRTKKDVKINVHDDNVMRENGFFRPFDQSPRDPSVWTKTRKERKMLSKIKRSIPKTDGHFNLKEPKYDRTPGVLIIQLKKNKVFDKTTYSIKCRAHNISNLLARFYDGNKNLIQSYKFNGETCFSNRVSI